MVDGEEIGRWWVVVVVVEDAFLPILIWNLFALCGFDHDELSAYPSGLTREAFPLATPYAGARRRTLVR